jgi:hypothetical protein
MVATTTGPVLYQWGVMVASQLSLGWLPLIVCVVVATTTSQMPTRLLQRRAGALPEYPAQHRPAT